MRTIRNCNDVAEAMMLKTLLESCGIEAFIPDELAAGVTPHFFNTNAGVRLQVAEEDGEDALRVIAETSR